MGAIVRRGKKPRVTLSGCAQLAALRLRRLPMAARRAALRVFAARAGVTREVQRG